MKRPLLKRKNATIPTAKMMRKTLRKLTRNSSKQEFSEHFPEQLKKAFVKGTPSWLEEIKSSKFLPNTSFERYDTTDNKEIMNFLPSGLNRPCKLRERLTRAIAKEGYIGAIIVIETKAINGVWRCYIVDGQHGYLSLVALDMSAPVVVLRLIKDSREEIVKLISVLNSNQKNFGQRDFANSYVALDKQNYITYNELHKFSKISPTNLKDILQWGHNEEFTEQFTSGNLKFPNLEKSKEMIDAICTLANYELPTKAPARRGFITLMRKVANIQTLVDAFKAETKVRLAKRKNGIIEGHVWSHDETEFKKQLSEFVDKKGIKVSSK